jgi:hypothetical protein
VALVGSSWLAGSVVLLLLLRLLLRSVRSPSRPPFSPLTPTQRARSGYKSLAAAVSASVKERALLFAPSPHEWCALLSRPPQSPRSRPRRVAHSLWPRPAQSCVVCHDLLLASAEAPVSA